MPARIEALTQSELTAEQQDDIESDFLGFFQMILLAFAGIALVVATFSIHNTFSILVAQRTRESALLRAIGASRRQVLSAVAGEALAIGVVASAIGFGVGLGLATGLLALMGGAGLDLPTDGLVLGADTIVIAAVVGVVTTLVASIAPALKASRVAPLAALRDVAVDRSATSVVRAVAGVRHRRRRHRHRRHRDDVRRRRARPRRPRRPRRARRLRRARPGRRPPGGRRARLGRQRDPRLHRPPRPAQRDAQPPAHRRPAPPP